MAKLTETKIKALRPRERAYKAFDAHGLYVLVPPSGSCRLSEGRDPGFLTMIPPGSRQRRWQCALQLLRLSRTRLS